MARIDDVRLQAQQLTGVAALAAKFAPGAADLLQTLARRAATAQLTAKLEVAPSSDGADARTTATLTVDGALAGVRVNLAARGTGEAAAPAAADLHFDGHLEAEDGAISRPWSASIVSPWPIIAPPASCSRWMGRPTASFASMAGSRAPDWMRPRAGTCGSRTRRRMACSRCGLRRPMRAGRGAIPRPRCR